MRNPFYGGFGTLLLLATSWAQYSGWSFQSVNERKNVPKSIRDNPGAYRSLYSGYPRYFGGK